MAGSRGGGHRTRRENEQPRRPVRAHPRPRSLTSRLRRVSPASPAPEPDHGSSLPPPRPAPAGARPPRDPRRPPRDPRRPGLCPPQCCTWSGHIYIRSRCFAAQHPPGAARFCWSKCPSPHDDPQIPSPLPPLLPDFWTCPSPLLRPEPTLSSGRSRLKLPNEAVSSFLEGDLRGELRGN